VLVGVLCEESSQLWKSAALSLGKLQDSAVLRRARAADASLQTDSAPRPLKRARRPDSECLALLLRVRHSEPRRAGPIHIDIVTQYPRP